MVMSQMYIVLQVYHRTDCSHQLPSVAGIMRVLYCLDAVRQIQTQEADIEQLQNLCILRTSFSLSWQS